MTTETLDQNDQAQARSICERAELINEQIKSLQADRNEIFKDAKSNGHDVKALKQCIKLRGMESADRKTQESVLDIYRHATGCE